MHRMTANSSSPVPSPNSINSLSLILSYRSSVYSGAFLSIIVQVAVINFSKTYSDYENPVCVNVNNSSLVVGMTTPHDIIMTDRIIETQVVSQ